MISTTRAGHRRARHVRTVLGVGLALVAAACVPPPDGGGGDPDPTPPVAVASVAASAGAVPFAAQFSSQGSSDADGTIEEYLWDLGDGRTSTEADPTHIYAQPGLYDVTLTVVDDDRSSTTSEPLTVTAHTAGDPASLVHFPQLSRSVGLGQDLIAVWTCVVEGGEGPVHDPAEVAAWAEAETEAWFETVSQDRYDAVFEPAGTFEVQSSAECLSGAESRTGSPYTNTMVVDTTLDGGGLGGPGSVYSNGTGVAPSQPPSESSRGFLLRGGSYSEFPNPKVVIHEIGHTLHWPHSFITPTNEYDNPADMMSGYTGPMSCSVPGWIYRCRAQNSLALNRWAAGWIDPGEVVVHTGGSRQVDLAGPESTGPQLVVAPSVTSSQALVTVEARPRTGVDSILEQGGVAVHVVDQRPAMCDTPASFRGCPSLWRRQGQAWGTPGTYQHVLAPGQSRTVHGLTISVDAAVGSGYRVTVSGTPQVAAGALQVPASLRSGPGPEHDGRGGWSVDLPSPRGRSAGG